MEIPSVNIKDVLVNNTSLVAGTDLFIGREPTSPDNITTVFDTPSAGKQLTTEKNDKGEDDDDEGYEYTAVQLRVRNNSYQKAMQLAKKWVKVLHGRGNFTINGTVVTLIEALDNPSLLDWDENNRARVVVNFEVQQTEPQT